MRREYILQYTIIHFDPGYTYALPSLSGAALELSCGETPATANPDHMSSCRRENHHFIIAYPFPPYPGDLTEKQKKWKFENSQKTKPSSPRHCHSMQTGHIRPVPQAANRRILPRPAQKPGGRRRTRGRGVAAAAEGRANADVAATAALCGADLPGRAAAAVRAIG
jgi:hypothetical protein